MDLAADKKAALKATADALSAPGKGFLASDESAGPWLRAGHVEAKKIPDTPENRAACACEPAESSHALTVAALGLASD